MLTDPQVLTVNAVAKSMPRVDTSNPYKSVYRYRTTVDEYEFTVNHVDGKITGGAMGEVHRVKCKYTVFKTATVLEQVLYFELVIQNGDGMDLLQTRYVAAAVMAWATNAIVDRLLVGES